MASTSPQKHKRIRLDPGSYAQPGAICSVTMAVRDRQPIFADPTMAAAAVEVLQAHAGKTGVPVYGHCVMPDHIHLVLGPSNRCDIITFVGQYKNLTQRAAWTHGIKGAFWQTSFWDHLLRAEEDIERVVQYVLDNPVRKGLADHWDDYPFSGSLVFHLRGESGGQAPALRISAGDQDRSSVCQAEMCPQRRESGGQAPALRIDPMPERKNIPRGTSNEPPDGYR